MESQSVLEINQKNFGQMYCLAKGYLYYNHFDKAERIIDKLLPFFRETRRNRYYAEILFQCAMIHWEQGKKGLAIRNVMESFLAAQNARYVNFYTNYGKTGYDVLEAYAEWMRQNTPEGWHRKKKYNYGNVLRMPMAEYIDVVLRGARKETRLQSGAKERSAKEHLTMMETIILQDISRGLTNAQICEEQNLKLPTVKTHIYSLYKKLGVKSRVQAVNKGKEMGIVK